MPLLQTMFLFLLLLLGCDTASGVLADTPVTQDPIVSIRFYGEAQCPYCRKFVVEAWNEIWNDQDLRPYLDYDFVPWGNAYFATEKCGSGPYDPQQRACWYDECIKVSSDDEEACFGGDVVYQHSTKEGEVDIYESCVLQGYGIEPAVSFTYCCEGDNMDDENLSAQQLMTKCVPKGVDPNALQTCLITRGRKIEISNAKKTPEHPGVPYVVIDGKPLDDPFGAKKVICDNLRAHGVDSIGSCETEHSYESGI